MTKDYRRYSYWLDSCGDDLTPREPLPGDRDLDVAIVGGGYTGLWTAYYLARSDPGLRIGVVERDVCGFGASGRNGGWCSALFAASRQRIVAAHGRDAAVAMDKEMRATVDEVARVVAEEGIEADLCKGGTLTLATSPAQAARVRAEVAEEAAWGGDHVWLEPHEVERRVRVASCLGAAYTSHCAALHPARLVRGLARVVEGLGVTIYEQTPALALHEGRVETARGTVKAPVVVRATEGYTPSLAGQRRVLAPVYSLMIVTEPLDDGRRETIGWEGRETLTDGRHLIIYAQRTADGRIAFGGRGAPYHFGSRIEDRFDLDDRVFGELQRVLLQLFPVLQGVRITHRWGGPLGVPRDWFPSVGFDRRTGMAWAGGYVGDGVATTNLAGRTIADLVLERDTDITRLPWVGHRSPRWEPEPLRFIGINAALKAMEMADAAELRTGRPSRRGSFVRRLIGAG